jgi:hypothetical protein
VEIYEPSFEKEQRKVFCVRKIEIILQDWASNFLFEANGRVKNKIYEAFAKLLLKNRFSKKYSPNTLENS